MAPGELIFHFLNTVILTALVALGVLWRYRVGVLKGMGAKGGAALALPALPPARPDPAPPALDALAWERQTGRRIALAFGASVALPALLLAALQLEVSELPVTPAHLLLIGGSLLVAAVPMTAVSLALPFWRAMRLAGGVLLAGAVLGTAVSMLQRPFFGRAPSLDQLLNVFTFFQYAAVWLPLPLTLLVLTGLPRIRGVAPVAFAGLLVFGFAPLAGSRLTAQLARDVEGSRLLLAIGLDTAFLALALPTALLAWWRLGRLGKAYAAKRFSDAQLLARCWWLMFCATMALELINAAPTRSPLVLAGAAGAYALFVGLNGPFLAWAQRGRPRPPRRTLLLLRVFGFTARTEKLFDRVGARWRRFGPVTMIGAPDVIARSIDPGDFLRFAGGHLAGSFVTSASELAAGLATMDEAPDPDGRYRVNEFCCRDDTWQATVVALMDRADVVLMDLRQLTRERAGCAFELEQLCRRLPPERVVLVVDRNTDTALIRAAMPCLPTMIPLDKLGQADTDGLFAALLRAGGLVRQEA